jgi:hypothetical protein
MSPHQIARSLGDSRAQPGFLYVPAEWTHGRLALPRDGPFQTGTAYTGHHTDTARRFP